MVRVAIWKMRGRYKKKCRERKKSLYHKKIVPIHVFLNFKERKRWGQ